MRLTIITDGIPHEIDSTDPELLGKWITEIFGRAVAAGITPATQFEVRVYPSWVPDGSPQGWRSDWSADTQIIGRTHQVHSPRELIAILAAQLDEAEKLAGGSDAK